MIFLFLENIHKCFYGNIGTLKKGWPFTHFWYGLQFIKHKKTQNPQQEKEIDKFYKKPSNRERVEDSLVEKKVLAYLTEFAKIKDVKINTKDLRNKSEAK